MSVCLYTYVVHCVRGNGVRRPCKNEASEATGSVQRVRGEEQCQLPHQMLPTEVYITGHS